MSRYHKFTYLVHLEVPPFETQVRYRNTQTHCALATRDPPRCKPTKKPEKSQIIQFVEKIKKLAEVITNLVPISPRK